MKKLLSGIAAVLLLVLCSGCEHRIDEKRAVSLVQKELSIADNVTAHTLRGGFGPSSVFLVTSGSQNYVVKFFKDKKNGEREIYNSKIASDGGYGPKVYFADPSQGIMISEYLSGKKLTFQDLESDQFYVVLAHLLQKIHHGKEFKCSTSRWDAFRRIDCDIQSNTSKCNNSVPITDVEHIVTTIRQPLYAHQSTAPCHNDLHGGNLVFFQSEVKAIDYGDAGPGDPYFDVATVAAAFRSNQVNETVLLTTNLGREPSAVERARFYLMKQVVLIKWACDRLRALSAEDLQRYDLIQAPSVDEFFIKKLDGKVDISKPEDCLLLLKVLLNEVLDNAKSQEFKAAVDLLCGQNHS